MAETLSYVHRFEKGTEADARSLLLLHGTGGDENDLVPLGRMVAPGAPLLSVRGKVLENGMPRFFRRFGEGIFDEDDLRRRANELADFVEEARAHYGIASPIALGYSKRCRRAPASAGSARGCDLAEGDGSIVANAAGRLDGQGSLDCLGYE